MFEETRGQLSADQIKHLLAPIKQTRVLRDGKGHSHVSQQDITAHLIRMFGFGGFDIEVVDREAIFETSEIKTNKSGREYVAWDVAYRALVRLTIRNDAGETVAIYENGSVGSSSSQPSRADAHDLAYKSSISLSIKRAAIALGDQFGLSLYNKGQTNALVIRTIVGAESVDDIQADIPQQVALGNDEIDRSETVEPVSAAAPVEPVSVTAGDIESVIERVKAATTDETLVEIYESVISAGRELTTVERSALSMRRSELKDGA
jgi:hypothetical protein